VTDGSSPKKSASRNGGFTLLEVLAAALIVAIIATLAIPSYTQFIQNAGQARCAANMRSITLALHGYLQDNQAVWPQGPSPSEEEPWEQFWLKVLRPYGISDKTWQCPSFNTLVAASGAPVEDHPKVHYLPTMFGPTPNLANRWATQPWLIERVSAHRHGAHICFPDGSVKSFTKLLAEQGAR
jgi:prepilin-type N-terminal cleavage/methylation domain-containing protein